ncbi:MAG: cytidylate kinase family protein [Deltaproteobacteria bacterium]|nr:cytidylate kinase family protein [Deltaproteobacteria bacterium]
MAIITLTRGLHSGGEAIAESIAEALGARCVSSEVLTEAAKKFNVPEDKMLKVFENTPTFWERMTESRRIHLAYIQATLADLAKDNNLVYHGNLGQELLREVPHVLKVRLMFPIEARVQRIMEQFNYAREQAEKFVEQIDEDRTRRSRYFFNSDWRDPSRYDIVLRMDRVTPKAAKRMIVDLSKEPEFILSEDRRSAFTDFIIKTRVYASLASAMVGRLSLINVSVIQGVVTLQGTLTSNESLVEDLVEHVRKIEGVRQVNNEIVVGLVYQEWNV